MYNNYASPLALPAPARANDVAAILRSALLADLEAHSTSAQAAHDWAVKQLTDVTSVSGAQPDYSNVDARRFKSEADVSALVDDVHRLMAMYPAARELSDVYTCRGFVSRDGRPYLVVNDHYADPEWVEAIVGPNFRVESKPSLAFPIVTLNYQG